MPLGGIKILRIWKMNSHKLKWSSKKVIKILFSFLHSCRFLFLSFSFYLFQFRCLIVVTYVDIRCKFLCQFVTPIAYFFSAKKKDAHAHTSAQKGNISSLKSYNGLWNAFQRRNEKKKKQLSLYKYQHKLPTIFTEHNAHPLRYNRF